MTGLDKPAGLREQCEGYSHHPLKEEMKMLCCDLNYGCYPHLHQTPLLFHCKPEHCYDLKLPVQSSKEPRPMVQPTWSGVLKCVFFFVCLFGLQFKTDEEEIHGSMPAKNE